METEAWLIFHRNDLHYKLVIALMGYLPPYIFSKTK